MRKQPLKLFKSNLYDDDLNNNAARVYSVQSAADRGCTVTAEHGSRWVAWLASHTSTRRSPAVAAGAAVAARLSRTSARVALVEAETDLAEGASKGNAGVAASTTPTRAPSRPS